MPPPRKGVKKAAKKAPPRKAAPAPDETQIRPPAGPDGGGETQVRQRSRSVASDAGGAAMMMLGGGLGRSASRDRVAEQIMADVRRAVAMDARSGGGTTQQDQAISRGAHHVARLIANENGGGPELEREVVEAMTEAMRTGDTTKIAAIKRRLRGVQAAASPERTALALFGLAIVDQVEMWGGVMPAFSSPASNMAHVECNLSVFCRNPLHPGPCKGWKGTLAKVAPGTLKLIEEERKKKLAAKKAAKAAAVAKASKIVDKAKRGAEVDNHPNAKKKLAKKATEQILGTEESKIAEIEGKTKLTQKEMAWHANKKAQLLLQANLAAGNLQGGKAAQQKYKQYARAQIMKALQADNESGLTGPDSEYQKTIALLSGAQAQSHANKHVVPQTMTGDDLKDAVANAYDAALQEDLKTGQVGHPLVNLKKLDKALNAIPGEPGDPEHDAAVGEAVGFTVDPAYLKNTPYLPPGALSDEDANKLAAGAGQMLALSGTPDDVVNLQMAKVKEKAQTEGFSDNQAAMVEKTAANQAAVVAAKHADGLDGFSPQGKKKFQKLLAAEMVAMLDTGDGPVPGDGSLADLVMQKQAGLISADEFHEKVQKKLKIKSKKQTAVQAPSAPAAGPAGGGAGAGGVDKAKASADVVSEIDDVVNDGPGGDSWALTVQAALNDPHESEAEKKEIIKSAASAKASELLDKIGGGLSDIEKQELHSIVSGMVEAAIVDPQHAPGAKNMIKNLKKKSPADLKDFAKAILSPSQAEENAKGEAGLSDAGSPSPAAQAKKVDTAKAAKQKIGGAPFDPPAGADADAAIEAEAEQMAETSVKTSDATFMPDGKVKALKAVTKAKIKKALESGESKDILEAKMQLQDNANLSGDVLTANLPDEPSVPAGPKHLSTATPPQAAAQIATQAQAAYEKLLPDSDGSALATPSAIAKLQQSIESGQTPEAAAASAATALAKAYLKNKIGTSKIPPLHEAALQDALANEIHEGMLTGKFPEGGHLDKLGNPKFGFVKLKIAAKKEYDKTGGLPSGPVAKTSAPIKVTSSKQDALDAALDDAFGPSTPAAQAVQPASPPDKLVKSVKAAPQFAPLMDKAIANYEATMAGNPSDEEKALAAHKMGGSMAGAQIFSTLEELDLSFSDLDGDMTLAMGQTLQKEWAEAVASGADSPGGLAAAMPGILAEVKSAADDAQKMNGFEDGSAALNSYKHALLQAKVEAAMGGSKPATVSPGGGAGAGGTGTGVNPAVPATAPPIKVTTGVQDVTPPGPTAPPVKVTPLAQAGSPPDLTGAKKVGKQGGFNPGGTYETPDGKKYYVKQQKSAKHARNEATAAALYREMGVPIPAVSVHDSSPVGDLTGTVTSTEIIPGAVPFDPKNPAHVAAVRRGFAVDAWLANWDAIGSSYNNVLVGPDGQVYRVDAGGAMEFGGAGGPKGAKFGDTVGEIDTLRNPSMNPAAAKIFGGMTDEELIDSMSQMESITPEKIREIVKAQGGDDALAEKLIKRRQSILDQLQEMREAQKNKGPLGTPTTTKPETLKLGGTKKKQTVFKPKGGYPISQVVVEGHENNVLEFNNKVEASRHSLDAAKPPTPQMTAMPAGAPKTALKYYTSNAGYSAMNGHLRKNKGKKGTTGAAKSIADADKAFESSRLSEPITTLRGVRGNPDVFGALWTDRRDQNWTGAEFLDHGYSSSSVQMGTARGFAGAPGPNAVVMRVHMPAGTRAINLGQGSQYPGEAEILLNRGARFRIVADNGYQNGARHLDVEVICDGEGCADAV